MLSDRINRLYKDNAVGHCGRCLPASLLLVATVWPVAAAGAAQTEVAALARDVVSLFRRHCVECHGQQAREGGLLLDAHDPALAGGDSGVAIVPGRPDVSELIRRVSLPRDDDEAMPPHGAGLAAPDVDLLRRWVAAGAPWAADMDATHWSYVPPVRPPLPPVAARGSAIDAFVAAGHEVRGLDFGPEADAAVLVRRLALDLTGLPPTVTDVATLEAAAGTPAWADALESFVERMLASDEFGVRWARMWLDLARYADSHGFQRDDLRDVWAYRDWVVEALNADMPFDRFTIEQVAGDLLPDADERTRIATGFHRCTPTNVEAGTDPEESRMNQVFDRVNTTGAVWLGTTLECAQCHDHKYDPFPQVDYYRLAAYFNSTEAEADRANPKAPGSIRFNGPFMPLTDDPWAEERTGLQAELAAAQRELRRLDPEPAATDTAAAGSSGGAGGGSGQADEPRQAKPEADPRRASIELRINSLQADIAALPTAQTLVMSELPTPRDTFVLGRGELASRGTRVVHGTPAVLGATPDGPPNRLTLARWLVSRENPLTARVFVNRIWHEIFGRGLVATVEDFGIKGDRPSHPELLDYLAVEFMENGWSLKRLVHDIVMSRTYRQDSHATAGRRALDPDNAWLSRGPRFRLDAEGIRDNALAIAGTLSLGKGGPPIRPPQPDGLWDKVGGQRYRYEPSPGEQQFRRGLYVVLKRGSPYPSFTAFDATARMTCLVCRSRSNTPLQALVLLNDPVYAEAAVAFARRVLVERPDAGDRERVVYAVRIALARQPAQPEIDVLLGLLAAERATLLAHPERVAERLAASPGVIIPTGLPTAEVAAWLAVTTALLNLDETITKG